MIVAWLQSDIKSFFTDGLLSLEVGTATHQIESRMAEACRLLMKVKPFFLKTVSAAQCPLLQRYRTSYLFARKNIVTYLNNRRPKARRPAAKPSAAPSSSLASDVGVTKQPLLLQGDVTANAPPATGSTTANQLKENSPGNATTSHQFPTYVLFFIVFSVLHFEFLLCPFSSRCRRVYRAYKSDLIATASVVASPRETSFGFEGHVIPADHMVLSSLFVYGKKGTRAEVEKKRIDAGSKISLSTGLRMFNVRAICIADFTCGGFAW